MWDYSIFLQVSLKFISKKKEKIIPAADSKAKVLMLYFLHNEAGGSMLLEKHLHGKRKSVRYPLSALTYAEFIAVNQQKHVKRYISRDISITGIFVNALEPLPEGTELIMTIYLDGASGVKLEASG